MRMLGLAKTDSDLRLGCLLFKSGRVLGLRCTSRVKVPLNTSFVTSSVFDTIYRATVMPEITNLSAYFLIHQQRILYTPEAIVRISIYYVNSILIIPNAVPEGINPHTNMN